MEQTHPDDGGGWRPAEPAPEPPDPAPAPEPPAEPSHDPIPDTEEAS